MQLEKEPSLLSLEAFQKSFIVMLLYGIGVFVMKYLTYDIIPDHMELRLAAFIPVAFGFVWGMPAAVGSMLAVFFNGMFFNDGLLVSILTGLDNFFLAYLPYRLWYAIYPLKASMYIYNSRTFLKFVLILLIVGFNFSMIISYMVRWLYSIYIESTFFIIFGSNFDIPVLFGIPLIIYLHKKLGKISVIFLVDIQKECKDIENKKGILAIPQVIALLLITAVNMATMLYAHYFVLDAQIAMLLMSASYMAFIYASTIKSRYVPVKEEYEKFNSIGIENTKMLLKGGILLVFMYVLDNLSYTIKYEDISDPMIWREVFIEVTRAINVIFLIIYFILKHMEKNTIFRLDELSKKVKQYALSDKKTIDTVDENRINSFSGNDELEVLEQSFNNLKTDINRYIKDLTATIKENESLQMQLHIAAQIQQGVLPKIDQINTSLGELGYNVNSAMVPASVVGGDMYDCFFIDDDHMVIMVADVSGKGIPGALFMMNTQAIIKNNAPLSDPGFILEKSNDTLYKNNDEMMFVTMWLGILEVSSGKVVFANAGHNPPLFYDGENTQWIRQKSGPVLGIMSDVVYEDYEMTMTPGSRILLYTDGINEAENKDKTLFGNDRLIESFGVRGDSDDVLRAVKSFVGDAVQSDDMTYLCLKRQ